MNVLDWIIARSWLLVAISLHLLWGSSLLLYEQQAAGVTAIASMSRIHQELFGEGGYQTDGAFMVGVSVLAALGLVIQSDWRHWVRWLNLALILPQQAILMMSAYGAITAVASAHYLDGTGPMPRVHLVNDQSVFVVMCLMHTVNIITVHAREFEG